jgi:hypothetical protein
MGRFGFSLLATGLAFVWLGWYYHAEWAIVPGLLSLAILTGLALLRFDTASFGPFGEGSPFDRRSRWRSIAFYAFYILAGVACVLTYAHYEAGGHGQMTLGTFLVLGIVLVSYDLLPFVQVRVATPSRQPGGHEQRVDEDHARSAG